MNDMFTEEELNWTPELAVQPVSEPVELSEHQKAVIRQEVLEMPRSSLDALGLWD